MDAGAGLRPAEVADGYPTALQSINQQDFETLIDLLATSEAGDVDIEAEDLESGGGPIGRGTEGLLDRTATQADPPRADSGSLGKSFDGDATITQESISRQRRSSHSPVSEESLSGTILSQPLSPNLAGIEAPSSVISPLLLATSLQSAVPDAQLTEHSTSVQPAFSELHRSVFREEDSVRAELEIFLASLEPFTDILCRIRCIIASQCSIIERCDRSLTAGS